MSITATVPSRSSLNVVYQTTINEDGSSQCTCPAGEHGRHCWHVAAVKQSAYEAIEAEWAGIYRAQLNEALVLARIEYRSWVAYHRSSAIKAEMIATWERVVRGIKAEIERWS